MVLSLATAAAVFVYARTAEHREIRAGFERHAESLAVTVTGSLAGNIEILYAIASFYHSSNEVERDEFHSFIQRDYRRRKGIQALEWAPRVPSQQRSTYERAARRSGWPDFQFKKWSPEGRWTTSDDHWAEEYFPVYFVEPYEGNEAVVGNDLASNPTRREALVRARDSGEPETTARVRLATEGRERTGVMIVIPIYGKGKRHATLEQRRSNLLGFGSGEFWLDELVAAALAGLDRDGVRLQIVDRMATDDHAMLFDDADVGDRFVAALEHKVDHELAGRTWEYRLSAAAGYVAARRGAGPWLILAAGLVLTLLLGTLLGSVTGRSQQIQRVVDMRTDELVTAKEAVEASNIELQQFAYIASHDLLAPLRAISGFAQLLQRGYRGRLDDEADDFINRIVAGARQMQTLIEDLLSYSRVEARSRPFEKIELSDVFGQVLEQLEASITDAGAEVTADELPAVAGDRSQLSQLLQNLIGNGIKYHGEQPPHVHVSAARTDDTWTISIRDNGIGIDPRHHQRIFEIFRRLHTEQAYPGTGIGLAVCRRVLQRHGGEIWVESEPGRGSTFHFTLPQSVG